MYIIIILGVCLVISLITMIVMSIKGRPILSLIDENTKLKSEISSLKSDLSKSESRRKNLLSINKGERALITQSLVYGQKTPDEKKFIAYYEVEILEVTDKSAKVLPIIVTTDNNSINSNTSDIAGIMSFLKNKWVSISDIEPILDTQVRREDKLSELV